MGKIEQIISEWSESISNEVASRTFINKAEMAAYTKVKLVDAVYECIKAQTKSLRSERMQLVEKISKAKTHAERYDLGGKIAAVNSKISEQHNARYEVKKLRPKDDGIIEYSKMQKIVKRNIILARVYEINKTHKELKGSHYNLIVSVTFSKNGVSANDTNMVCFKIRPVNEYLLSGISIHDVVEIEFDISGISFINSTRQTIYVTNLIVKRLCKNSEPEDERSVATK